MPDRTIFVGETKSKKTLTDSDIATHQRRTGPSGAVPGTDADAHTHTDSDAAPKAGTDADAAPATDRDR
jgi:hypothetical protein